jgi:hypothetical protein
MNTVEVEVADVISDADDAAITLVMDSPEIRSTVSFTIAQARSLSHQLALAADAAELKLPQ